MFMSPSGAWWCSLPPSTMVRHVQVWKQALSHILSASQHPQARNMLLILQHMYQVSVSYID